MKKIVAVLFVILIAIVGIIKYVVPIQNSAAGIVELKEKFSKNTNPRLIITKFTQLQKKFNSPRDVTAACIGCHNGRHKEVMQSNHWNWEREEYVEGRGVVYLGKKNAINNFCIGVEGNEESCAKCHIGLE